MGFFDFLKGKKKNTDENASQENINESSSNVLEEFEGIEVTPFEPEEKGRTPEEIFRNKQEFKADITIAKIPDITAEDLERAIHEDEEETEEIEEVTEIIDEPEISEEITENAEEIEETTENTEEVSEEVEETTEEIEEVIEETVEEEKEEIKEEVVEEKPTKKGFFAKLFAGLDKTRKNILGGVDAVLGAFTKIDEELFEELEEVLIMADIGVETTMNIIDNLRKRVKREKITDPQAIKGMLVDEITELLNEGADDDYDLPKPTVMLVIGVNGVGKTTTIGKLSHNYKDQGDKVLLAAADTFRAAAIDQLKIWGERAGIDVIRHEENSDPAAVVFDAVNAAKNRGTDILICDTAGRLHNKKNLMEELKKISKVIDREYPQANKEVYLVLDATTGQNAMQQAKLFKEVADITGIILTKLDGTAKGGIVIAIKSELNIPVRYIGVGEGINDLQKFNARDFASALFGNE